jgi:DnaJ-class molecular chaperone
MNFGNNEPDHVVCPRCHGEGYYFDDTPDELAEVASRCDKCEGDGWVYGKEEAPDA